MTAKEWLLRGWKIDGEIKALEESKMELKDRLTSITRNTDGVNVSSSKDPHKFDSYVVLCDQIDQKLQALLNVKTEIFDAIYKLEDTQQRQVLLERYVNFHTLEETAVNMNYSYQQICRIQGDAFINIQHIIDDETKCY